MNNAYWRALECEECCFTCKNNRNNMRRDYPCNCEFLNRDNVTGQDMWCKDYEIIYSDED